MRDDDWYKPHPDRPAPPPRQPKPGEEVWRLRDSDTGRMQTCELRDNSRADAGWEVQILEAGEILPGVSTLSRDFTTVGWRPQRNSTDCISKDRSRPE